MNALQELIDLLGGKYFEEEIKKGYTPGGIFINQNSYGLITKDNYSIKIHCYASSGIRAVNTIDGSPYKLVLILPFILKKKINIFPKSFIQKILSSPKKSLSMKSKVFSKKYSIGGNKEFANYFLKDSELPELVSKHLIYISTNTQDNYSILNLRPDESVITKDDLRKLFDIFNRIGELITTNQNLLKN